MACLKLADPTALSAWLRELETQEGASMLLRREGSSQEERGGGFLRREREGS